ncbi:peptidoglycan-binding domain-containing protein [Streptomyces sp. NPDC054901]
MAQGGNVVSGGRCPGCGAVGAGCGCADGGGFDPMRIRPYVTLTDPGGMDAAASLPPVLGAVTPTRDDTQRFRVPAPLEHQPWPGAQESVPHTADTRRVRSVSGLPAPRAGGQTARPVGAGRPRREIAGLGPRRPAAPLLAAAAVIAVGGTAMALLAPDSSGNDVMLSEIRPSAPVASTIAPVPSPTLSVQASGHSPSPSASRSPSPSASRVSPSASPASSLPAAPSTPPSPSPIVDRLPSHEPPPSQAPILRFGDSGPEVERLQRLLARKGLYKGKIHGRFDRGVRQALSKFQLALGIEDDGWGTYDPSTRRALEE